MAAVEHDTQNHLLTGETLAFAAGEFPLNANSTALARSQRVKSGAGTLFGFTVTNTNVSGQWILWMDAQNLPADGIAPKGQLWVPGSATRAVYWGEHGRRFLQGIWLCNSSSPSSKTIGSADCWFDAQYV